MIIPEKYYYNDLKTFIETGSMDKDDIHYEITRAFYYDRITLEEASELYDLL